MSVKRTDVTEAVRKEAYTWFYDGEVYDPYKLVAEQICDVDRGVNEAYRQYTSAFNIGEFQEKPAGTAFEEMNIGDAWSPIIRLRSYGGKVTIERETKDHTQKRLGDLVKKTMKEWPQKAMETKDGTVAALYNNGGLQAGYSGFNNSITGIISDASGNLIYDSEPMFNLTTDKTNRTLKAASGTYFNANALDLDNDNFETMHNLMATTNNIDENGEKIGIKPTHILHGTSLEFAARRIIESTLIPGSMNNDTNVLQGIVKVLPWDRITDTDAWALIDAGKGMKFLQGVEPEIDVWIDEETKDINVSMYFTFGVGVVNWRCFAGCNWATS